ncbi:Pantothenate synthetase [Neolewinella maritima]|uniref:Pantothenate synthetase n=1 Tax=Neolewinella maritima TaxID=1383882 RepID=A0ABM9AYN5_9BACT|nr:pantoate--beta-alanine ligase [Neolewinella maritima]CAH0999855.1 Pantothenate synthetase [Neolewinella maritima]
MLTLTTAAALADALQPARAQGKTIGFVPTMGALHQGHAALIDSSVLRDDITVASIFVNPTQFNESADLSAYPRTPLADQQLLAEHGCHFLYLPGEADVYPQGAAATTETALDLGDLVEHMEGRQRPGHFAGVVQVVRRLLDIVQPTTLYLGQKDYQQVAIVRYMIERLNLPVQVHTVTTVREDDGLALSSRNRLLTTEERRAAAEINRELAAVTAGLRSARPARELEQLAMNHLSQVPLLEPEYVMVVDGRRLQPYQDGQPVEELVVAAAVRVGQVRLIDNRIAGTANPTIKRDV